MDRSRDQEEPRPLCHVSLANERLECETKRVRLIDRRTKMLRDRFKAWNMQPKYNKSKQKAIIDTPKDLQADKMALSMSENGFECGYSTNPSLSGNELASMAFCLDTPFAHDTKLVNVQCATLSRALDPAPGDRVMTKALRAMQNFFGNLAENIQRGCLRPDDLDKEQAFEVQRIVASAHQAVASQVYASHKTFADLKAVGERATEILPKLNISSMHPRVLTVLLRLIVPRTSGCNGLVKREEEADMMGVIKALFARVSTAQLFGNHPVSLLCVLPDDQDQTDQLLRYQLCLAKSELYDKIRSCNTEFVTLEEIYSARVLASVGYTAQADTLLDDVLRNLSGEQHLFIHAEACRTLGFSKLTAGLPDKAIPWLDVAVNEFQQSGNGRSENVLYTHICLAWAYRQMGELDSCEQSLWNALALWTSEDDLRRNSSAIKIIRDLDQVLYEQGKLDAQADLRAHYATYFEDVRD